MEITLRSQMIAGATAIVGAGAIALTPVAPAVSIPSISTIKAEVALTQFFNPISALLNTGYVLGNYTLNGVYSTPGANWPGSGTYAYPLGIGAIVNAGLPLQGVKTPGLLTNILATPFPALTKLISNQLGYAYIAGGAALTAASQVSNILWSIPATAVQVGLDLLSGNFPAAIADIQAAIQGAVVSAQSAIQAVIGGATTIISSIATKGQAVLNFLLTEAAQLPTIITSQVGLLVGSVQGVFQSVVAAISQPNPVQGVWNALVNGLLDASVSGSLPATVINLTQGAGIQAGPIVPGAQVPFVPSVRTLGTIVANGIAGALATPVPTSASAVRAAAAVEAAPAAEATPGDNSAAAKDSTASAPAASAAADDSTASAAPKASKASAARAGR